MTPRTCLLARSAVLIRRGNAALQELALPPVRRKLVQVVVVDRLLRVRRVRESDKGVTSVFRRCGC